MRWSAHKVRDILPKIVEQSMQDMIWNAKAVNRSSKCNPGSQTVWFEKSLPVIQHKTCVIVRNTQKNEKTTARTAKFQTSFGCARDANPLCRTN
jgi:hypothetical protein